jgi:copper chaperone NosL
MKLLVSKTLMTVFGAIVGLLMVLGTSLYGQSTPKEPTAKDKCPICGMFVKEYPRWWSEIMYEDGTVTFFDGPKDLFKYILAPEQYAGNKSRRISAIYVREYYSLQWIDARSAYFVIDSDVYGPMGNEFVSLSKMDDAAEFKRDHGGSKILRFNDVDWQLLTRLSLGDDM